jgi:hypothetical protein
MDVWSAMHRYQEEQRRPRRSKRKARAGLRGATLADESLDQWLRGVYARSYDR